MTTIREFALSTQHKTLVKSDSALDAYETYLSTIANKNGVVIYLGNDFGSAQLLTRLLKKSKVVFVTTQENNKRFDRLDNIDVIYGKLDDKFITFLTTHFRTPNCIAIIDSLKEDGKLLFDALYQCLALDGFYIVEYANEELAKLIESADNTQFVVKYKDVLVCKKSLAKSSTIISGNDEFFGRSPDVRLYDKDQLINELSGRVRSLESMKLHTIATTSEALIAENREKDRKLKSMAGRILELEKKVSAVSLADKESFTITIADLERRNKVLEEKLKAQSEALDTLMKEAEVSESDAKEKDEQKQNKKFKKLLNLIKLNKFTKKEMKSDVRKALSDNEKDKAASSSKLIPIKALSEDELKEQVEKKQSLETLYKK
jgi:hypothetical protein